MTCSHRIWREDGKCRPCSLFLERKETYNLASFDAPTKMISVATVKAIQRFVERTPLRQTTDPIQPVEPDPIPGIDVEWLRPAWICPVCGRLNCLVGRALIQQVVRSKRAEALRSSVMSDEGKQRLGEAMADFITGGRR